MFQHILVPLDGSSRAERALPLAAHIARSTGGSITLLRAVEPQVVGGSFYYSRAGVLADDVRQVLLPEARTYLDDVAHRELLAGIPVKMYAPLEPAIESILSFAQTEAPDLIVMCSHGYTGLKHWALGSVAQKIARHSNVPVIVLKETAQSLLLDPEEKRSLRAVVALDGSPLAEATLLPTLQLVAAVSVPATPGELCLLRVVPPVNEQEVRKYVEHEVNILEYNQNEAMKYLNTTKQWLSQQQTTTRVEITTAVVENKDVAMALIEAAEAGTGTPAQEFDVMSIATHGRGMVKRWMVGSITERILERSKMPLLIVRPAEMAVTGTPVPKVEAKV